jgi:gamma-glutamyltranspeptidase/glutathione hydrolase
VSFIQSNYGGFGSGLAVGGFGLQNRGAYFSLDPSHVNRLEPGKRTLHTIMAAMVCRGGLPWLLFGAVGGDTQPQTHVQVLTNIIDHGMNIQEAIEAPRFVLGEQEGGDLNRLRLEDRFDTVTIEGLAALGYGPEIARSLEGRPGFASGFGLGHGIVIDQNTGARFGGADPRWDAYAIGY